MSSEEPSVCYVGAWNVYNVCHHNDCITMAIVARIVLAGGKLRSLDAHSDTGVGTTACPELSEIRDKGETLCWINSRPTQLGVL